MREAAGRRLPFLVGVALAGGPGLLLLPAIEAARGSPRWWRSLRVVLVPGGRDPLAALPSALASLGVALL